MVADDGKSQQSQTEHNERMQKASSLASGEVTDEVPEFDEEEPSGSCARSTTRLPAQHVVSVLPPSLSRGCRGAITSYCTYLDRYP
ncbi:hypothetical protein VTO42DRAFT_1920 [Malbranchea cinnamomea]